MAENHFNFIFETEADNDQVNDILRNLNNIFSIPEGTMPLMRGLGLSWDNLSKIPPDLENDIVTDIVDKVAKYEPRVAVSSVEFEHSEDGKTTVSVYLEEGEENGE